ncbi:SDR family oxidoreductase [Exiguobacterium sp. PBE]|uniref:SDR family oxidoreductase n=1 Tax=unclassified Exiguobacterium TaxID=2644629 RepID=UPI0018C36CBC|nr:MULTISPECIES: SDR family oxidoreductase [unclassified Exiguobacterium]MBG0917023.1 SDR family oxidoreductase [Exiguobacterium sp. SRB7LM]MDT0191572.1 SDR family oxidoreductase [Exiguobacterium sp. BG5(2022)]QPI69085.1 SDR family oxidoreductase [Exiguobacterium sp. PBE]
MNQKQTIVITGASSGIGRATVELFSKRGWHVAATMRRPEDHQELSHLKGVSLYQLDVTNETSIREAFKQIVSDHGTMDVLLNNAGYGAVGIFEEASPEQIQRQFDTNVFGVMNVIRTALPYFRKQRSGRIVTVSSVGGQITFPIYSLYHSSKWAIEGFIESLQFELAPFNIDMKLIEPGPIKTDFYGRSQELVRDQPLDVYDDYTEVALHNTNAAGANAEGPDVVAETIWRAATERKKRLRYPAGKQAGLLIALKRYLPNRVFFAIVRGVVEKK